MSILMVAKYFLFVSIVRGGAASYFFVVPPAFVGAVAGVPAVDAVAALVDDAAGFVAAEVAAGVVVPFEDVSVFLSSSPQAALATSVALMAQMMISRRMGDVPPQAR